MRHKKKHKKKKLQYINDLIVINGWILANVLMDDKIYVISSVSGYVYGIINCKHIFPDSIKVNSQAVLNGITYNDVRHTLIVTGKYWPEAFEIELPKFVLTKTPFFECNA